MGQRRGAAARRALPAVNGYCPELAEEVCRRVAMGESVQAICSAPGMPWPSTLWCWTRAQPGFAARLREARRSARLAQRVGEKLAAAARAAKRAGRKARRSGYTAEVGAEICTRLSEGESLIAIVRDPDMPCASTVYDWIARHAEFEAMYLRARQRQADYLFDEAREVALGATPQSVWADRLRFDTIRWQAARLAPRKYCEEVVALESGLMVRAEAEGRLREIVVVRFERGPNDEVLVIPPRNAAEEQAWARAYGRPYDGPPARLPGA